MLMKPLPTLDNVFNLVLQQERQFNLLSPSASSIESQSSVNHLSQAPSRSSHNPGRGRGRGGRGNRLCTHCNRTNHTIETCFLKHGYPPGFQQRKPTTSVGNSADSTVNSIQDAASTSNTSPSALSTIQEQYTQILQLLQQSNLQSPSLPSINSVYTANFVSHTSPHTSSGKNSSNLPCHNWWIIDTGATDHITHIFASFLSTYHIAPKSMTMPNGDSVTTTIAGSVLLCDSLVLHNVYYFPSFHVNISSIPC